MGNDGVPLVSIVQNVDTIKKNASDIPSQNNVFFKDNNGPEQSINHNAEKTPNKFFNFLEDESANMNVTEQVVTPSPIIEEEVEMLDFDIPSVNTNIETIPEVNLTKDMSNANILVEKLVLDLQNSNYNVELIKDEGLDEIKYEIIVK